MENPNWSKMMSIDNGSTIWLGKLPKDREFGLLVKAMGIKENEIGVRLSILSILGLKYCRKRSHCRLGEKQRNSKPQNHIKY